MYTRFIDIFRVYSPIVTNYVLPYFGLAVIAYTIYLIWYIIKGDR